MRHAISVGWSIGAAHISVLLHDWSTAWNNCRINYNSKFSASNLTLSYAKSSPSRASRGMAHVSSHTLYIQNTLYIGNENWKSLNTIENWSKYFNTIYNALEFFYTVFQPFRNISWQHLDKAENVNNLHDRLTLILIISTQFPSFSCLVDNFKHWMQVLASCHTGSVCKIIYSYLVVFLSVWEICLLYKPTKSVIDFVHGR